MNYNITIITLLLILGIPLQAQKHRNFPNVDEMHEKKWKMISKDLNLTPEEINNVKPIFIDYEKKTWELHKERRKVMMDYKKENNINYCKLNDDYINFELKQAQLLRAYHLRLKKTLKPETLFNYYKAERMFKRKLLQNMPPPPRNDEN
ncbi:MAG: hypothetical protein ACK5L7_01545 [Paludibacteraceae bacterium]